VLWPVYQINNVTDMRCPIDQDPQAVLSGSLFVHALQLDHERSFGSCSAFPAIFGSWEQEPDLPAEAGEAQLSAFSETMVPDRLSVVPFLQR
jgi:hypothetical protein